jgi:tRNA dimethylallyltransferase
MARGGIVEEARALVARWGDATPRLPIGYDDAIACARGAIDVEELGARIALLHRRYARRQVVWLRGEQDVEWLVPPLDVAALGAALRTAP